MRVLVTRPRSDAERTAERLRAQGHDPVVAPVLEIERTGAPPPAETFDALVLTSANAAPALADLDPSARERPLFAVGERTAAAARALGWADIHVGEGDGAALARLIARALAPGAMLVHVAGRDRKAEPARSLAAAGFDLRVWTAYRAVVASELAPCARGVLARGELDAALHFSRRSAAALVALAEKAGLLAPLRRVAHVCISEEAAAPLREAGAGRIAAVDQPAEEALLALLAASSPGAWSRGASGALLQCQG